MKSRELLLATALSILLALSSSAEMPKDVQVEESTESPLADMSLLLDESSIKTSTDRPSVNEPSEPLPIKEGRDNGEPTEQQQRKTVADFIIHPLIAFKPRVEQDSDAPAGKQASNSTNTSPWSLFAFNAGQGFGSSVSSLAGSVSGWLSDRIPSLVESPVRETTTTSTTTTTTTPRPDIIVRVQHKPTRKPLVAISNQSQGNNLNSNHLDLDSDEDLNSNRFHGNSDYDDDEEDDEFVNEYLSNNRRPSVGNDSDEQHVLNGPEASDEQEQEPEEYEEDEEDEEFLERPPKRQRPLLNQRRRVPQNNYVRHVRRRIPVNHRIRPSRYEDSYEDLEDFADQDDSFYYGNKYSSTRRSQNQPNFIQRGQQSLIKQIRQLTRGRTPAEVAASARIGQQQTQQNRRRQGTLLVNRNGQPVYLAPQLQQAGMSVQQQYYIPQGGQFPQPPLTTPIKRKGRPTQYITIPWSQLGIQPPNRIVGVAEGLQSQPLIFKLPPSAIPLMQNGKRKNQRPAITAEAVPLLAEASLMDIFQPPKFPPSRTSPIAKKPSKNDNKMIAGGKQKPVANILPQRIKPVTVVEKAPVEMDEQMENSNENNQNKNGEKEFIIVGEDNEPGLTRQAQAIYGDARYLGKNPFIEVLGNGRFALRKSGRSLEQQIPVQIVLDEEDSAAQQEVQMTETPNMEIQGITDMTLDDMMIDNVKIPATQTPPESTSAPLAEMAMTS